MNKYKLVSEYGNAFYYVETESERNALLLRGFRACEEEKSKSGEKKEVKGGK